MPATTTADLTRSATAPSPATDETRARDDVTTGLHGHPLAANVAIVAVAEAIGTFILMLTIISTAIGAALAIVVASSVTSPEHTSTRP
jgi:hypothetical protein